MLVTKPFWPINNRTCHQHRQKSVDNVDVPISLFCHWFTLRATSDYQSTILDLENVIFILNWHASWPGYNLQPFISHFKSFWTWLPFNMYILFIAHLDFRSKESEGSLSSIRRFYGHINCNMNPKSRFDCIWGPNWNRIVSYSNRDTVWNSPKLYGDVKNPFENSISCSKLN